MSLLSGLRRVFSGKSNVIQTREGAARLPGAAARSHWIVGRALCMYRREDFSAVPRSKRRAALELKLPVWSPFERTGHHCVWAGGAAMVWFWDADEIGPGAAPEPARPGARPGARVRPEARPRARPAHRILPETVFYPRKRDGVHLQACREGFELQLWQGDVLADAFWFPEPPDEGAIGWFLDRQESAALPGSALAAAAASSASPPLLSDSAIVPDPWRVSRTAGEWLEANERTLVSAALLALALAAVWQEARFWKLRHLEEEAAAAFTRMQDDLGPLLAARNDFVRERRTNLALKALLREPSQAHVMALVSRALPSAEAEFREWRYQQRELRVVVTDPAPDPIAYVRALESEPLFEQVRAEPVRGDNRLQITLRIRG